MRITSLEYNLTNSHDKNKTLNYKGAVRLQSFFFGEAIDHMCVLGILIDKGWRGHTIATRNSVLVNLDFAVCIFSRWPCAMLCCHGSCILTMCDVIPKSKIQNPKSCFVWVETKEPLLFQSNNSHKRLETGV